MAEIYSPEEGYRADGIYPVQKTHELKNPLHMAIEEFESAAMRFSLDFINDAKQRDIYQSRIKTMSTQVLSDVNAGNMSAAEGAAYCNEMRNQIMRESRLAFSPEGRAYSQKIKPDSGVPLEKILNKKSNDAFNRPYEALTKQQRDAVHYEVIESAGKHNYKMTRATKNLRVMGKVLIVVTAAMATHAILTAEDKRRETVKQASSIGGGIAGGALAGLAVSPACGPGAPVCAVVLVLIGSIAGALAVETVAVTVYDAAFMEEAEEFSKWVS
jgi:hypothetical protein